MTWYWISTKIFTAGYACDEHDVIRKAAPILRKWIGHDRVQMEGTYSKYRGTMIEKLGTE